MFSMRIGNEHFSFRLRADSAGRVQLAERVDRAVQSFIDNMGRCSWTIRMK